MGGTLGIDNKYGFEVHWLQWFVGFCDAEANFQTFPKKRYHKNGSVYYNIGYGFHLGLHSRDAALVDQLNTMLGNRGNVYNYPVKQEVHLAVTKLDDLKWLSSAIFGKYPLLTIHQWNRYCLLDYGVSNSINRAETLQEYQNYVDDNNESWLIPQTIDMKDSHNNDYLNNWISGFINGEGSFYIKSNGTHIFSIEQAECNVLSIIKEKLSFSPKVLKLKQREGRKITWSLTISSKKDIFTLIEFFESGRVIPLQGYKYIQYKDWADSFISKES